MKQIIWFIVLCLSHDLFAQEVQVKELKFLDVSTVPVKSRNRIVMGSLSGTYISSMVALHAAWYKNVDSSPFHLFDDALEWQQMDKAAHFTNAYQLSNNVYHLLKWAGNNENKSGWLGGSVSLVVLTSIEVFDGFSSDWGFSVTDAIANTLGTSMFIGQQVLWNEQRIRSVMSFHPTEYAKLRPGLLGKSLVENVLKDYNGLTFWISVNPTSFYTSSSWFPPWLDIALGYGAEGMTGGHFNPAFIDGKPAPEFERYRKYFLSVNLNGDRVNFKNPYLRLASQVLSFIKIPAPALEFADSKPVKFHWLYF